MFLIKHVVLQYNNNNLFDTPCSTFGKKELSDLNKHQRMGTSHLKIARASPANLAK